MHFEGKTVLVTGAGGGTGHSSAIELAREGADLTVTDIDKATGDAALAGVVAEGLMAETRLQDVTDRANCGALVDDVVTRHDGLDVLFNVAGGGHFALVGATPLDKWRHVNVLNFDSVFFGT